VGDAPRAPVRGSRTSGLIRPEHQASVSHAGHARGRTQITRSGLHRRPRHDRIATQLRRLSGVHSSARTRAMMRHVRRPLPPTARSVVFRGHLDRADDAGVQRGEVLGRDPVFQDGLAAGLVDLILVQERSQDFEAGDVPGAGVLNVPVAGDLGCIFLVEYRVKDRLPGQAWRPLAPSPRPRSGPVPPARSAATASHCQARQPCLTILAVISSRHWISSLCRHSCVAAIRVMQVGCCASTATWWGWTGRPGGISSISRRAQNRGVPAGPLSITATADPRPGHHGDHDRACHHVNGSHRA